MRRTIIRAAAALALTIGASGHALAAGEKIELPSHDWSFTGIFGEFDRAEMQRGLQIYQEACSGCHSLDMVSYRNLAALGYSEDEIAAIAAEKTVIDGPDDEGEMFERPARPSDKFVAPFPNPQAAMASNGGAFPPDLSVIVKARKDGYNYLYALMTGYSDEIPEDVSIADDAYYNAYFPGHQIAMPSPLSEDLVEYADGTPATVEQMAHDVTVFLAWAGSPEMEQRKRIGIAVMIFLVIFTGLLYAYKRKVWADLH
jgi:ubiquinol-cytochrome c reductase cytochrome c1 subunit